MDKPTILLALQKGELDLQGQFLQGSNYTFMGELSYEEQILKVVYKPTRGEQPLWDFPTGTLAKREVAAFMVSEALAWDLVPPTIYRRQASIGPGSLQFYIEHDPNYHYFNFTPEDHQRLRPTALFDLVINNADRKGSHVLVGNDQHIRLIDHGVAFHVEDKLRTVIWDFAGEEIPGNLQEDLLTFLDKLQPEDPVYKQLLDSLRQSEIRAMARRVENILDSGQFPYPPEDRRVYPWPPV
jgi:uncharacterized repeat protein (TIGR03843 family)